MKSTEEWNKEKEIESLNHELFHADAHIQQLHDWIKSDSVLKALQYMDKNQHHFALTDVEYMHLYLLCLELRKADKEYNESRKDAFDQQLP